MTTLFDIPLTLTSPNPGLRVRRDWQSEIAGLTGLLSWFSARPDRLTKDGSNLVSVLDDRSTNGYDMVVTGGTATKPTYVASGAPNGTPVLRFAAASNTALKFTHLPTTGDFTKIILFRKTGTAGTENLFSNSTSQANTLLLLSDGRLQGRIGTSPITPNFSIFTTPGDWTLVIQSFDYSAGTVRCLVNNVSSNSSTAAGANTTQSTVYLGASSTNGANGFTGDIAEVGVLSVDLLDGTHDDDLQTIIDFLNTTRGTAL